MTLFVAFSVVFLLFFFGIKIGKILDKKIRGTFLERYLTFQPINFKTIVVREEPKKYYELKLYDNANFEDLNQLELKYIDCIKRQDEWLLLGFNLKKIDKTSFEEIDPLLLNIKEYRELLDSGKNNIVGIKNIIDFHLSGGDLLNVYNITKSKLLIAEAVKLESCNDCDPEEVFQKAKAARGLDKSSNEIAFIYFEIGLNQERFDTMIEEVEFYKNDPESFFHSGRFILIVEKLLELKKHDLVKHVFSEVENRFDTLSLDVVRSDSKFGRRDRNFLESKRTQFLNYKKVFFKRNFEASNA